MGRNQAVAVPSAAHATIYGRMVFRAVLGSMPRSQPGPADDIFRRFRAWSDSTPRRQDSRAAFHRSRIIDGARCHDFIDQAPSRGDGARRRRRAGFLDAGGLPILPPDLYKRYLTTPLERRERSTNPFGRLCCERKRAHKSTRSDTKLKAISHRYRPATEICRALPVSIFANIGYLSPETFRTLAYIPSIGFDLNQST